LRKVCGDYAAIFEEIEGNPSCTVAWNLADHAAISKPRFVPLSRRKCVQTDNAVSEEEPENVDSTLSLICKGSNEELHIVGNTQNSTGTNLEIRNTDEPEVLLQRSQGDNACPQTDLPTAFAEHQENEHNLDTCVVNDRKNDAYVSVDCVCDPVAVTESLADNLAVPCTGVSGILGLHRMHEMQTVVTYDSCLFVVWLNSASLCRNS